jgi:hypothetical protein
VYLTECVAGECVIQLCDTGFHDCDGIADNGCERQGSAAGTASCGPCGIDCTNRPHTKNEACHGTRDRPCYFDCESGWADVNHDYTDGCEAILPTVAAGTYGACTLETSGACPVGERCLTMSGQAAAMAETCGFGIGSYVTCWCSAQCNSDDQCPKPANSTAVPFCEDGLCGLMCPAGSVCPGHMSCTTVPLGQRVCATKR